MRTPHPRRCPAPALPLPGQSLRHALLAAVLAFSLALGACDRIPTTAAPDASPEAPAALSSGPVPGGNNCPPGYRVDATTCFRGAQTISNSSRLADCPSGYTNNGATCGRGPHTIDNGGSTAANCPAGYTYHGLTCGRGAHTFVNGSIPANCPAGFTNMGTYCYQWWPPASLSWDHMTCPAGWYRNGGLCYRPCPQGYVSTGEFCFRPPSTLGLPSMTCPAPRFMYGGRCYLPCPAGYENTLTTCFRPASTLLMSVMTCRPNEFKSGARCYVPCPVGYTNTGETCFRPASTLPRRSSINWNPTLPQPRQKFYNIAHMANTPAAATWAVGQGANGLEMDLRFDSQDRPYAFVHGGFCDCSCGSPAPHICSCLSGGCDASTPATTQLRHVAMLPGVALVYIDSKVDRKTTFQAGIEVVRLLERDLFGAGYRGVVIVAAPATSDSAYIRAAAGEARRGPNARRYFFGFDMVSDSANLGLAVLSRIPGSPNLVYSTGTSACSPVPYYSEISGGVALRVPGSFSLTGIWTVDLESSMINYLQLGVNAIMTNRPGVLKAVLQTRSDLQLAAPTDSPPLRG